MTISRKDMNTAGLELWFLVIMQLRTDNLSYGNVVAIASSYPAILNDVTLTSFDHLSQHSVTSCDKMCICLFSRCPLRIWYYKALSRRVISTVWLFRPLNINSHYRKMKLRPSTPQSNGRDLCYGHIRQHQNFILKLNQTNSDALYCGPVHNWGHLTLILVLILFSLWASCWSA